MRKGRWAEKILIRKRRKRDPENYEQNLWKERVRRGRKGDRKNFQKVCCKTLFHYTQPSWRLENLIKTHGRRQLGRCGDERDEIKKVLERRMPFFIVIIISSLQFLLISRFTFKTFFCPTKIRTDRRVSSPLSCCTLLICILIAQRLLSLHLF